jgi:ATP-dependent protease ClpP protease subunit
MTIKDFTIDTLFEAEEVKDLSKCILPDYELLDHYYNLSKRIIYWNADIDEFLVDASMKIIKWNLEDKDKDESEKVPIKIFINSDGGCVNSVLEMISIISLSKTKVITIGLGKVYSSGFLLICAGHERLILEHTSGLLHSGSTGTFGNTDKLLDYSSFTKGLEKRLKKYVLEKTSITEQEYDKRYREDWWFQAEDLIKYKVADRIVTNISELF